MDQIRQLGEWQAKKIQGGACESFIDLPRGYILQTDHSYFLYPLHVIATTRMVNPAMSYKAILKIPTTLYRGLTV